MRKLSAAATNSQLTPGTWAVDDAGSHVRFEVGNLWGLAKVRGEFERVRGVLAVGPYWSTRSSRSTPRA